jgi:hypothetical protein
MKRIFMALALSAGLAPQTALAADPPDSRELVAAQRQALAPLAFLDGTWRGPATLLLPGGQRRELVQTERVGSFLGGALKLIEGRGHGADGTVEFNALAVVSFSPQAGKYNFRSYAQGYSGDFAFELLPDGFVWSIPAGPATLRYTATVKDGVWTEFGERLVPGQAPVRTFEMRLLRLGDTEWPAAGAVPPK